MHPPAIPEQPRLKEARKFGVNVDREEIDYWCEKGILWLVAGILVYSPLATGTVRPQDFLVVQGLTLLCVLLWLVRIWVQPRHRLLWPPIAWIVCAFIAYAIYSYWQAPIEYVARDELVKVLTYGALFLVILDNFDRQESVQTIVFVLIFVAMAVSMYALYQLLTNSPFVWHFRKPVQYMKRGSGTFICPNHLAGFLEMILPIGLAFTLASRLKPTPKVFIGYASLVILAGLVVSMSRGGWAAASLSLIVFFVFLLRSRSSRVPALVFLVLVVGAGAFFLKDARLPQKRLEAMVPEPGADEIRFYLWKPAIAIWKEDRWLGAGPGHFDYRFRQHRPPHIQMRPVRAHNDYLNTLADWGLIGAAIIASAFGTLYYGLFRSWKFIRRSSDLANKPSNRSAFVLGAAIGLLAILLHSAVDFNMHIPANALVAVSLMALLSTYVRYATERYWVNLGWIGRGATTLLGLALVGYLGHEGVVSAAEQAHLLRAEAAEKAGEQDRRLQELKAAFEIEPMNADTAYRIGEVLRLKAWSGSEDTQLMQEALRWFELGMRLNPLDPWHPLRYAMALDWLGRPEEAEEFFMRAHALDPNSYFIVGHIGWHHYVTRDYAKAKQWLVRSHELKYKNEIMTDFLPLVEKKLAETGSDSEG